MQRNNRQIHMMRMESPSCALGLFALLKELRLAIFFIVRDNHDAAFLRSQRKQQIHDLVSGFCGF